MPLSILIVQIHHNIVRIAGFVYTCFQEIKLKLLLFSCAYEIKQETSYSLIDIESKW